MNRRDFLALSTKLTASLAIPASLVGCGGSSATADGTSMATTSSIDGELATANSLQVTADGTNTELDQSLNDTLVSNDATPAAATSSLASPKLTTLNAQLVDFFKTRTPRYEPYNVADQVDGQITTHYLASAGEGTLWDNALSAHQLAYQQYTNQYTKLVATMRLFDSKNDARSDSTTASSRSVSPKSVVQASARSLVASPRAIDALDVFEALVASIVSSFGAGLFNLIAEALQVVYTFLSELIGEDQVQGLAYSFLVSSSVDDMLQAVTRESTANLSFDNRADIMLSLSKISIAATALLALVKMNDLEAAPTSIDTEFMTTYLANNNVFSNLSLMWLSLSDNMMSGILGDMQASAQGVIDLESTDDTYATTSSIPVGYSQDLQDTLKSNSTLLALTSLAMKSIYSLIEGEISDAVTNETAFSQDSTADVFKILFTSEQNSADASLSSFLQAYSSSLNTTLTAATDIATAANDAAVTAEEEPSAADAAIAAAATAWSADPTNISLTLDSDNLASTKAVEEDAVGFASELADFLYEFTVQTEGDASEFATYLAGLAYAFTMDIESDAFDFAMQGMEYGYLFASQGEDVGVMADRILWMAVQIGLMADRIGEMGDRIVYTEQLIVYTEILILDFGILIYGVIKQITNLILTSLALILDREWYSPESEDLILDTIGSNVNQMLGNMNEYSLAVLDNQSVLRQLTLDSLVAYADYSEPEVV